MPCSSCPRCRRAESHLVARYEAHQWPAGGFGGRSPKAGQRERTKQRRPVVIHAVASCLAQPRLAPPPRKKPEAWELRSYGWTAKEVFRLNTLFVQSIADHLTGAAEAEAAPEEGTAKRAPVGASKVVPVQGTACGGDGTGEGGGAAVRGCGRGAQRGSAAVRHMHMHRKGDALRLCALRNSKDVGCRQAARAHSCAWCCYLLSIVIRVPGTARDRAGRWAGGESARQPGLGDGLEAIQEVVEGLGRG